MLCSTFYPTGYYRTIVLNSRSGDVLVGTKTVLLVLFGFVLSSEIVLLVP